ncbi:TRAP transporter large permease [Mesorhizobium sp. M6A.T.Cr.TU.014.01.1.1]|uniref:TRAP transporter large permease n=5 Tax=unclassified Mesorhizobium TaxID=325217 RepID=UPI000FD2FA4E|nr:TRAP transporter large permease [Mesorhizobium sp. M6A.T.Cr.TU.014.01.1.1]RVB73618.1 TRAP transporter large permease [Mesorhizobium sp. M6A.T.Cr.TU.014.01.1.1]
MTLLVLFGIFAVTLYTGVPVAWAIAISTLAVIFFGLVPLPPSWFAQQVYGGADSISLAAIPLFLVAGGIMNEGGLTRRIIDLADDLLGWVRGGLGVVNVATCMVYGGITGSATADTGAVGSIMIPAMVERGYPPAFAAAVTAAAGTLGIIIPPSVVMIMYGVLTNTSIGGLFAAGIIPGLMLAITFMLTAWWVGVREGFPKSDTRPTIRSFSKHLLRALPAMLMPIVVLGSMLTGYATTTEAAFVAVVWALLVGGLLYRELTWAAAWKVGIEAVRMTGAIMIIMAVSTPFSWILTVEQIPQWSADLLSASGAGPTVTILLILLLLTFVGTWADLGPSLIILAPIVHPIGIDAGLAPYQLGLIFTVALGIGLFTPPVGTNIFVVCNIAKVGVNAVTWRLIPFFITSNICLLLIAFVPGTTEWLPRLLGF